MDPADVARFYPAVTAQAALDVADFHQEWHRFGARGVRFFLDEKEIPLAP